MIILLVKKNIIYLLLLVCNFNSNWYFKIKYKKNYIKHFKNNEIKITGI